MVAYNITLNDISPMIQYTGSWIDKHEDDTKTYMYFGRNFAATRSKGDAALLRFNGTGIWAYGARRGNHGKYQADLDGTVVELDGFEAEPGTIQTVLFSQTGLDNGVEHVLTLTNAEDKWFDVDYYVIQHEETDPSNELELRSVVVDVPGPDFFTYTGKWNFGHKGAEYNNDTAAQPTSLSYADGDSISFSFIGTSVAVYGPVNMNRGIYTVTCDGVSTDYLGYYDAGLTGGAVLFHRANLGNATHTVTIVNRGAIPTDMVGIDYVQYNYTVPEPPKADSAGDAPAPVVKVVSATSTSSSSVKLTSSVDTVKPSANTSATSAKTSATPSVSTMPTDVVAETTSGASATAVMGGAEPLAAQTRQTLSNGVLAGIIIGAVTGVMIVALLVWYVVRKRRNDGTIYPWQDRRPLTGPGSASDGHTPMDLTGSPFSPYQNAPFAGGRDPNAAWTNSSSPQMVQRDPFVTGPVLGLPVRPHPPASNVTSYYPYAQSVSPPTEIGEQDTAQTQSTQSTERAYSGMNRSSPFHHTAPSSGAIPSEMGDAEIRTASHAGPSRPNILSLSTHPSSHHMTGLSPYLANSGRASTARSLTPTSSDGASSFSRRKQGVALPATSRQPSSALSEEQLSQIRMIVEGRPQDWGPVPEENILPPDYSQATEPLPGQLPDDRVSARRFR